MLKGARSLSDAELLAILLRVGTKGNSVVEIAKQVIKDSGGLVYLAVKSAGALQKTKGIGKDKSATLLAAFELARRLNSEKKWFNKKVITSPEDIGEIFIPLLKDETKENFIVVSLNTANRIIKYDIISTGTLSASVVHPREVFKAAIDNNSANIVLIHNHPSGNLEPSREDIKITNQLVEAGKIFDISVFDHIIIAENSFTSFVERKLI